MKKMCGSVATGQCTWGSSGETTALPFSADRLSVRHHRGATAVSTPCSTSSSPGRGLNRPMGTRSSHAARDCCGGLQRSSRPQEHEQATGGRGQGVRHAHQLPTCRLTHTYLRSRHTDNRSRRHGGMCELQPPLQAPSLLDAWEVPTFTACLHLHPLQASLICSTMSSPRPYMSRNNHL